MIFNYIRVSTALQNTDRQLAGVACDREYMDKLSGKDTNRPQLQAMIDNLREGDIVNVHSMDRLARNVQDLLALIDTVFSYLLSYKRSILMANQENYIVNLVHMGYLIF